VAQMERFMERRPDFVPGRGRSTARPFHCPTFAKGATIWAKSRLPIQNLSSVVPLNYAAADISRKDRNEVAPRLCICSLY
jgi:hypothetical protein